MILLTDSPGLISPGEQSTSDPDASSDETEAEPTITSLRSWTRQRLTPNLEALSPRSQAVMVAIGQDVEQDYQIKQIADRLGQTPSWVSERLEWLRSEVALQTGFLALSELDYDALRASIDANGVQTPVLAGQHLPLVDGLNRWNISVELGIKEIPVVFLQDLTEEQERVLSIELNVARRHLNFDQRVLIVRSELNRDWNRSDRWIGRICGVDGKTVGSIRTEMRLEQAILPTAEDEEKAQRLRHDPPVQKPLVRTIRSSPEEGRTAQEAPFDWQKQAPEIAQEAPNKVTEQRSDPRGHVHEIEVDLTPKASPSKPAEVANRSPLSKVIEVGNYGHAVCAACDKFLDLYWDGTYFKTVALEHE